MGLSQKTCLMQFINQGFREKSWDEFSALAVNHF
jgi:hypothetical protein